MVRDLGSVVLYGWWVDELYGTVPAEKRKGKSLFFPSFFLRRGTVPVVYGTLVYDTKLLYYSSDLPSLDLQVIAAIFFFYIVSLNAGMVRFNDIVIIMNSVHYSKAK